MHSQCIENKFNYMYLSIITINYNNKNGLKKTVESIRNQKYQDFEYIIIDGGSDDGSLDVIIQNNDIIDFWVSEADNGIYHAMNKGIAASHGKYLVFMNSGDKFHNDEVLKDSVDKLGDEDIIVGDAYVNNGTLRISPQNLTFDFLYQSTLCHQAAFIKADIMKKYKYDEHLKIVSDWKFFLEALIIDNCTYSRLDVLVADYDSNGISYNDWDKNMSERKYVLESLFPCKLLKDYENLKYGVSLEDQLWIDIRKSKFHKILYSLNVIIIRIFSKLRRGSNWIKKYPIRVD